MMIMIGEKPRSHPTVHVPPWDLQDDTTANIGSPFPVNAAVSPNGDGLYSNLSDALQRFLPSNVNNNCEDDEFDDDDGAFPVDAFACDNFRMFEFKVRRCARGRSHDWTECPYAHPGEKARRRDPRKVHYSGTPCPDFRRGTCVKGDDCEYAHGVFECWLHPTRYRTQPCKDGTHCRRRVCFFAHTPDQLRVLPQSSPRAHCSPISMPDSYDGSPGRVGFESFSSPGLFSHSPSSSPPLSPSGSMGMGHNPIRSQSELAALMRNMQIGKMRMGNNMGMSVSPPAWVDQMGSGYGSPRSPSTLRPGFMSLPSTPTRGPTRSGLGVFDLWDKSCQEEPVMERVESGRDLRAKIYAKLSKENALDRVEPGIPGPDFGWISELVK